MAHPRTSGPDVEPKAPQLPPTYVGTEPEMASFVWQQLREMQAATGSMQEAIKQLSTDLNRLDSRMTAQMDDLKTRTIEVKSEVAGTKSTLDSVKTKVDDLVKWKHMIIGGAIALGAVVALLGFLISKAGDYITFKAPTSQVSK